MDKFVLDFVSPGIWTGKAGSKVVISVRSVNGNATTLNDAAYPDGTEIEEVGENAEFEITEDQKTHTLNVGITPPPDPDDWSMVEVASDGTTQDLLDMLAGEIDGDIEIVPS